ncbi:GMC oxidoreductase [Apiospora hydei]|uniref:GMC oxidoreductase n=1 Tax=Apiospora hydei TaxID=1337664 RepID=A0ABR1VI79_9PEZI
MWLLHLLCWAVVALGAATNQSTTADHLESTRAAPATQLLSQLSSCALKCVVQEAPKVGCGILDVECQCTSEPLYGLLAECVIDSCTIAEAIGLAKVDAQQCHRPTDTRERMIAGISIASAVVILGAYILRIISRLTISRYCWWDDLFHTLSIGFVIPMTVFANLIYVCQILWAFNILALKISILCLYLRLFPGRRFRIVCTSALALLVVSSLLLIAFDIFQCNPVSAAWTLQHGDAQCMDLTVVALANAAVNIFTEAAILVIPLPILVKLKMSTRQKAEVIGLLSLGAMQANSVIIVAAIRIPSLQTLKSLVDATYTNAPVFVWTCVEAMVAHLCVAAPAIKLLFTSVKTQVSTSLENSNTFGYYQSFDGKGARRARR